MHRFLNAESEIVHYTIVKEPYMNEHYHRNIELLYVLEGSIRCRMDEQQYTLHEDDVVIINSSQKHSCRVANYRRHKRQIIFPYIAELTAQSHLQLQAPATNTSFSRSLLAVGF